MNVQNITKRKRVSQAKRMTVLHILVHIIYNNLQLQNISYWPLLSTYGVGVSSGMAEEAAALAEEEEEKEEEICGCEQWFAVFS